MNFNVDFAKAPLLVIWEITRACALACRHCRASAEDIRHPGELSLEEGYRLIDQVAAMGTPLMIFTGGDPFQRDDLEDLIRHGKKAGLRVGTIPATTHRLTRERMASVQAAGVDQIAVSIDGATSQTHDDFRKVQGSFEKAIQGAAWAKELGIPLQVNTVLGAWNADEFDEMAALVTRLGIVFWEVFFLVPTGRGTELKGCNAVQMRRLFERMVDMSKSVPFVIKITEGSQHRAFMAMQRQREGHQAAGVAQGHAPGRHHQLGLSAATVNAGRGFCFVDHLGNICPSGFLPLVRGNVRTNDLAEVYRTDKVFLELRDSSLLKGRCGACRYRDTCTGGSRARGFAATGDYLASDPLCILHPNESI